MKCCREREHTTGKQSQVDNHIILLECRVQASFAAYVGKAVSSQHAASGPEATWNSYSAD